MLPLIRAKVDKRIMETFVDCARLEENRCEGPSSLTAAAEFSDVFQGSAPGI